MSAIDWDDAFQNGAYVPGSDKLAEIWAHEASVFRAHLHRFSSHSYGADTRQGYDFFIPQAPVQGTAVFIHGGYWHKFDQSYWSHFAAGLCLRGWRVAMPGYRLAPQVCLREITQDIAAALNHIGEQMPGPLRLLGHSAGGHLVARALMPDSGLAPAIRTRIEHAVAISGIFDLRPLLQTKMNEALRLDAHQANQESPALFEPPTHSMTAWVGAIERPEFLRQTRLICERWGIRGIYAPERHHFSVLDALRDPHSDLVNEVLRPVATD